MPTYNKIPLLLTLGLSTAFVAAPSHAVTQRDAYAEVFNDSSRVIEWVKVTHKYSTNYQEQKTWRNIRPRNLSGNRLRVKFNTGFGTTGQDWWVVSFSFRESNETCITSPTKLTGPPGDPWKKHTLRKADANRTVRVTVYNRRLSIVSPSGASWTTFKCRG